LTLPNWFILQAPPNVDLEIDYWKKLAWHRVQLLEQLPHNASLVIRDNFPIFDDALDQIYDDYRLGAYLLRLVAATNRRLEAWLIESEGDLFEQLYYDRTDSMEQKIEILETIFGSENVMKYEEFKYNKDEEYNETLASLYDEFHSSRGRIRKDFLICVHFSQVPWMVSNRRGYLRKGWVVSNEVSFRGSLKRAFERILQNEIEKAQNRLGIREDIDQAVQEIENKLSKHTQIRSQFAGIEFEGRDLQSHPEVFPPCIINLFFEFEQTGRLTHVHRLQLGFFLKKIGMTVDEQLFYWFEKSVDNVGVNFENFQRTSGYQIRHLYGLEGGRKDYEMPKCSTIATGYFCPFVHLTPNILSQFLKENYLTQKKDRTLSEKQLARLISQSSSNPTQACTEYFRLIYRRRPYRKIVHPLQWTRDATKLEGLQKKPKEEESSKKQDE
jgi:DNA primase large subunit